MTASAAGPCTPAYAGLTRHGVSTTSGTCLYPRVRGADTAVPVHFTAGFPLPRIRGADGMVGYALLVGEPLPPHARG